MKHIEKPVSLSCGAHRLEAFNRALHLENKDIRASGQCNCGKGLCWFSRSSPQGALIIFHKLLDPLRGELVCDVKILPRLV